MKIQINETLRALLPRLPSGELAALKADIEARGVRVPIDVAADGTVLDGHHRYEIAPDCPYEVVPDSELWGQREKRAYALRQGGLRRHLSGEQKAEYNRQRRELARELIEEDGYTQAVVAGMLGVDQGTIARWADTSSMRAHKASNPPPRDHRRKVKEDEEDEIIEQLATGKTQQEVADEHEISQQRVAQIKKKREREAEKEGRAKMNVVCSSSGVTDDLTTLVAAGRKFGCIYADPPWAYDNKATRSAVEAEYKSTMTVAEICREPVKALAADACHLHLWTTNGFLFDAKRVMDAWGFEYKSCFVWVKPQIGIGNYWRVSHEFLLLGVRGDAKRFNAHDLRSWIEMKRGGHSEKPEEVRQMIVRASDGPYLEMYGRKVALGWTVYGNEVEGTVSPDIA
jgi:N6-adenosine-specific RNA methylase IME4/predicted transcriptional regulator